MKLSVHTCDKNNVTILSLNCRSIRSLEKRSELHAVMYEHNADIIIGSELHLDHTYLSSEIFPHNFTAIRKDLVVVGENHLTLIDKAVGSIFIVGRPLAKGKYESFRIHICIIIPCPPHSSCMNMKYTYIHIFESTLIYTY